MKTSNLKMFKSFEMNPSALLAIKGGLCACKQAAPYACETAGWQPGTGGFANCMGDVYADCNALDSSCDEL